MPLVWEEQSVKPVKEAPVGRLGIVRSPTEALRFTSLGKPANNQSNVQGCGNGHVPFTEKNSRGKSSSRRLATEEHVSDGAFDETSNILNYIFLNIIIG